MFETEISAKEWALIEGVAKIIDPGAWLDNTCFKTVAGGLEVDVEFTKAAKAVDERNRARACDMAIDIIAFLRRENGTA